MNMLVALQKATGAEGCAAECANKVLAASRHRFGEGIPESLATADEPVDLYGVLLWR